MLEQLLVYFQVVPVMSFLLVVVLIIVKLHSVVKNKYNGKRRITIDIDSITYERLTHDAKSGMVTNKTRAERIIDSHYE
ncbi:MAG: hypothetical protein FWB97_05265 [Oscillospiraceae bacterium]|nr:hypothetical protein [Oscillospiraceae bacterium]